MEYVKRSQNSEPEAVIFHEAWWQLKPTKPKPKSKLTFRKCHWSLVTLEGATYRVCAECAVHCETEKVKQTQDSETVHVLLLALKLKVTKMWTVIVLENATIRQILKRSITRRNSDCGQWWYVCSKHIQQFRCGCHPGTKCPSLSARWVPIHG